MPVRLLLQQNWTNPFSIENKGNPDISRKKYISVIHLYVSVCINKECSQTNIFSTFFREKISTNLGQVLIYI